MLLKLGADTNIENENGMTPFELLEDILSHEGDPDFELNGKYVDEHTY